jgi:diadenylate cyclase
MGSERRRDPSLLDALRRIAPGTELRVAIENVIKGHLGALIVLGDTNELQFMFSGGMKVDLPFTPQYLYELAKMDGAIVLDHAASRIVHANVQLMPDPTISSAETGTRHRTAERVARQTSAFVISISQQRDTVSLYVGEQRYQLEDVADVLAKTNQAVATLQTYRQRLDQVVQRLTALEFQGAAMLDDVLVVLQRLELADRVGQEIVQDLVELGSDGRLLEMQLSELIGELPRDRIALVRDYAVGVAAFDPDGAVAALSELPYQRVLEFGQLAGILGHGDAGSPLDTPVAPRGYRALAQLPRVNDVMAHGLVARFGALESLLRAPLAELEEVDGLDRSRAREVREALRRLQEHTLADRYLSL